MDSLTAQTAGDRPSATLLECSSVIARVVVHARGALVTREVALPEELPDGVVDVAVPGVTPAARPGSARAAAVGGERTVSAVHAALVVPRAAPRPGPTQERVRELSARLERVADEHRVLSARRSRFAELSPSPRLRALDARKRERDVFDLRFDEALRMAALLDDRVGRLDERLLDLEKEQRELTRALEAARLEDQQTSTLAREGERRPTRTLTVRLVGRGRPGRLLVTYAVAAARWWPSYTLRLADGGATWTFEALVAQRCGEDWSNVALSLSSADLVFDARLPELPSLRFGRAAPPRRAPFRPAPEGVDDMFASYLAFGRRARAPAPAAFDIADVVDELFDDDEDTAVRDLYLDEAAPPEAREERARSARPRSETAARSLGHAPGPAYAPHAPPGVHAPPAPAAAPHAPPAPRHAPLMAASMPARGGRMAEAELSAEIAEAPAPPEIVPSDTWRDHDALALAGPDDPRRGRLVPRPDSQGGDVARACREVDAAADARLRDPAESRGMFDYRYEAGAPSDVPSDARLHRVAVASRPCSPAFAWRAVPSEALEVFREAHVTSPFDTGLLGGPIDVYLDGSLLTTTTIDHIDRGGTLSCGMGVDDRVKVARNVRVDEESAGLLGGARAVTHTVSVELASTRREPLAVTVLERLPVTDDKALEVKLVRAHPAHTEYDQADRGAPVRGGCRFDVTVAPGERARVELVYRLVFAQKLDIVGGSRRG